MRMPVGFGILAVCFITSIGTTSSVKLSSDDRKPPITIRADDIGKTVKVIGRFNYPLHEVVALRGTWVQLDSDGAKPDITLRFRVTRLDGKHLDKPVEFYRYDVAVMEKPGVEAKPMKGEQWELRAYETWPVRNHPPEYWEELGVALPAPPPRSATRIFGVLKQRIAQ